ncbi:ABC-F family ATP-binding cassette domain-containing protein [Fulvivirga sedimenti]|uniref:ABC-F family ATP-binding cassette domain-containing protein n=1 Tax=Fulvivirga sedimenti TaxID=2879465 RepID=A0A9X1KYH3_9BACT|nr:ABC-F family ATP-binding cassette domain-containing protein [Fulvivirga sedimenti]MCA6077928.1 ABC-F family ATP-binding cassette domain-containing protein [Fulvivirga sedimenti]
MNLISADNISIRFGDRLLLDNVSFGLEQGRKVALVGVNGCGKSTLLRILAGEEAPSSGEVAYKNDLNMAYLPQQPDLDPDATILEAAMDMDDPVMEVVSQYEQAVYRSAYDPKAVERLTDLASKMDSLNAWNYESKVKEILGRLGLHDLEQKVGELSGGQQKRVGLARALLQQPELLLLDEPTNHLDLDIIEWLEEYLSANQMSILMVTHDRYFLESVTNEIVEIDQAKLFQYNGNYSYFLEKKQERYENDQARSEKARNLMRKELEWIRRQPKARGTKAKYRIEAFEELKKDAARPASAGTVELDVSEKRLGGKIIELQHVSKSYGETVILRPFSYIFRKGEKIGIVGKNGSGKTTFLEILSGRLEPDSGVIDQGVNTHIGYFRQEEPNFKPGERVIDIVRAEAEVMKLSDGNEISASQMLQRFNFSPSQQYDIVDKLSGGEKRRLQLLLVLLLNPNFLILDEPTNDLDLITLQVLEDFLQGYKGCLIVVSHDRYFMNRMVDHLFIFEKGKDVEDFNGTYLQYRDQQDLQKFAEQESRKPELQKSKEKARGSSEKLSFKEKREMEQLEADMEILNSRKAELIESLNSGDLNHEQLREVAEEIEKNQEELDSKELRWLELSEKEG